jgi:Acyl-CoA dehydrogenase, C-terminal domain
VQLDLTIDDRQILESVRESARRAPAHTDTAGWWALLAGQGLLDICAQSGDEALALAIAAEAIGHELIPVHFGAYMTLQVLFDDLTKHEGSPALRAAGDHWRTAGARGFAAAHEVSPGTAVAEPLYDNVDTIMIRRPSGWSVVRTGGFAVEASSDWTGAPVIMKVTFDPGAEAEEPDARRDANQLNILLHAAELVGVARESAARTRQYLLAREQFGRPIGSFQALQHRMVDVVAGISASEALVEFATWMWGERPGDPALTGWVHSAAGLGAENGLQTLSEAFTLHGGMAMTAELWVHRWYRRAVRLASFQGDASVHLERAGAAVAAGTVLSVPISGLMPSS